MLNGEISEKKILSYCRQKEKEKKEQNAAAVKIKFADLLSKIEETYKRNSTFYIFGDHVNSVPLEVAE